MPPATGPTAFCGPWPFPVALAGIYKVFGGSLTLARLVQAVIGTVTVGVIGLVAAEVGP